MTGIITILNIGTDAGPFNLFSDVTSYLNAFETNVDGNDLLVGFASYNIPDGTTIIRARSIGDCTNYIDIDITIPEDSFIFSIDTRNTSPGSTSANEFKLPLTASSTINATVNWGDGNSDVITAYNQAEVTHTYSSEDTYRISITGVLNGWKFNNNGDKLKILTIYNWGDFNITESAGFYGCTNLTQSAVDAPIVTSTSLAFYFTGCSIFNGNLNSWSTVNVTDISHMFSSATSFNTPLLNWDMSNVTNMSNTFSGASNFNQILSTWNLGNVVTTSSMFSGATSFNQDISSWNVSSITNMSFMFLNSTLFDQDLSSWDINQVTNFLAFMQGIDGLSTSNYDALLVSWEAQTPQTGININFGGSTYTIGSAAETARASLVSTYSWTITDGGGI